MNIIDVGSWKGIRTTGFLKQTEGVVFAIDPNPQHELKKLVKQEPRVKLIKVALSDHAGIATYFSDFHSSGKGSICAAQIELAKSLFKVNLRPLFPVLVDSLDGLFRKGLLFGRIGFLKVDTEGNELEVLRGGVELLKRDFPVVEFEALTMDRLDRISLFLKELGYVIERIDERNFLAKPVSDARSVHGYRSKYCFEVSDPSCTGCVKRICKREGK